MSILPVTQEDGTFILRVTKQELRDITLSMKTLAANRASKRAKRLKDTANKVGIVRRNRGYVEVSVVLPPDNCSLGSSEEDDS